MYKIDVSQLVGAIHNFFQLQISHCQTQNGLNADILESIVRAVIYDCKKQIIP